MSGLLLKDFYTIGHNAKQMMLILLIWAVCFLPGRDGSTYIIMCASLCGMMTATTFTFDDKCHWEKYAMILPISKKAYVLEKYVLHMIFSLLGVAAGTTVTVVANWFQGMRFKGPLWQAARIRHFHGSGLPVASIIVEIWFRKGKDHFVRSSVYSDNPDCCIGVFSGKDWCYFHRRDSGSFSMGYSTGIYCTTHYFRFNQSENFRKKRILMSNAKIY